MDVFIELDAFGYCHLTQSHRNVKHSKHIFFALSRIEGALIVPPWTWSYDKMDLRAFAYMPIKSVTRSKGG